MKPTITPKRILIAAAIAASLAVVAAAATYALTRPSQDDLSAAKTDQITAATEARKKITPALNDYLSAFKAAYNESKSAEKAMAAVKKEYDAFVDVTNNSAAAIKALDDSRISNDGDIGPAVGQLKQDYDAEVVFYRGLVDDYPRYTTLFAKESDGCAGIFVGETSGLADRKAKLDAAAKRCYEALGTLKASKNVAYADYAKKVERRVKRMQSDADATVKAEVSLKEFETRAEDYKRQYADATARNAPDEEIQKLADELKKFNAQIAENKAGFDYAAKSYLDTVREMPALYAAVFDTAIPARQKTYDQLVDYRMSVLSTLVNGRVEA